MSCPLPTTAARREVVLSAVAKLERDLRARATKSVQVSDQERQKGNHGNRAYWSGFAEGERHAAKLVDALYHQLLDALGGS